MEIIILVVGLLSGILIGYLLYKVTFTISKTNIYKELALKHTKTESFNQVLLQEKSVLKIQLENLSSQNNIQRKEVEHHKEIYTLLTADFNNLRVDFETLKTKLELEIKQHNILESDWISLKDNKQRLENKLYDTEREKTTLFGENTNLKNQLLSQKTVLNNLQNTFEKEFKIASQKILEQNNERFMNDHQKSLGNVLKPLENDLVGFKTKIEELYVTEAKERFSLSKEIQKLNELNHHLKEEAKNLTKALKTESKTQGGWGEMILESILEKSGLRKDEEYFMESQLTDEDGKPLKSQSENKKMRPDAVIKYPGDRHVIIDSKVSLNAYLRYVDAENDADRNEAIENHIKAIKTHITTLSAKGYDDYNKALDFVMMFIPSEPAYIAAIQHNADLWNYAYEKRILLLNPTNLITSLKLIVDLWKREYQNKNVQEIIDRGSKMYDKFVGFIDDLDAVGDFMEKAKNKHSEAFKKLKYGNDNLILQMDKLEKLGLKNKKNLHQGLVNKGTES